MGVYPCKINMDLTHINLTEILLLGIFGALCIIAGKLNNYKKP